MQAQTNNLADMVKEKLQAAWAWVLRHQPTLDYARLYWDKLIAQWYEHLFETTSPVGVAFVVWWLVGAPPATFVLCALVWVFLLAGYYAWRDEHLKTLTDDLRGEIYGGVTVLPHPDSKDRSAKAVWV
jgi:hypothetical protein